MQKVRALRHFLIMMILCPWVGGTIIGYSAYLDSKVTDASSAIHYFYVAVFGVLIFGLLVTCIVNFLSALISYIVFSKLATMNASNRHKKWWISVSSVVFAIVVGTLTSDIARGLKVDYTSLVVACLAAGAVGAFLNTLNWLSAMNNKTIQ